ncbi:hypothetical protein T484DRAFT_1856547, partial [Baffinella frigidus]
MSVSCTLGVVNRAWVTGPGVTHSLRTVDASEITLEEAADAGVTLEEAADAAFFDLEAGALGAVTVSMDEPKAGFEANTTVIVTLSSRNALPASGVLEVAFSGFGMAGNIAVFNASGIDGAGFGLEGGIAVFNASGIDGTFAVSVRGSTILVLNRTGDGTEVAAGATFEVHLSGIVAPFLVGSSGTFQVAVFHATGLLMDQDLAVTPIEIGPGLATAPRNFS